METRHPNNVRREILAVLYEEYQQDPLKMLTPDDLMEAGAVRKDELPPNAYYLYDRGFVEMMIGYNPPLFDAMRISPTGIDLFEDVDEFNRRFPAAPDGRDTVTDQAVDLMLALGAEADGLPITGLRRDWLLRDLTRLWEELRRPSRTWRKHEVQTLMDWIRQYFPSGIEGHLPAFPRLEQLLAEQRIRPVPQSKE